MAQKNIDFGSFPDDPDADAIRTAFQKTQENFTELYQQQLDFGVASINKTKQPGITVNQTSGNVLLQADLYRVNATSSSLQIGLTANSNGYTAVVNSGAQTLFLDLRNDTIINNSLTVGSITPGNPNIVLANGNITASGRLTVIGNANVGNLGTAGLITATGNITGGNLVTGGSLSVTGNANVTGNLTVNGNIIGNITGNISGNVSVPGSNTQVLFNNNGIIGANANLTFNGNLLTVIGNANATFFNGNGVGLSSLTGANVTGQVANATVAGTVYTAAQPNITSVGTLTSLTVSGTITGGNLSTAGNLSVTGNATTGNLNTTILKASANVTSPQLISNVATGTAPLLVSSTTKVDNLNADLLDGYNSSILTVANTVVVRDSDGSINANVLIVNSIAATTLLNGNSNVSIPAANGNVNISATGNANILVVTGTGVHVAGRANITGNANVNGMIISQTTLLGDGNGIQLQDNTNGAQINWNNFNYIFVDASGAQLESNAFIAKLDSSGNFTLPKNISIAGNIANAENISANNTIFANLANITANLKAGNISTTGVLAVTGNANVGNLNGGNLVVANFIQGDGYLLTNVAASGSMSNGNSNVNIPAANGNVNISVAGNANVLVVTGTGANITGTANVTGNANVGNLGTGGLITATGNITGGNITTAGIISATGNITGGNLTTLGTANVGELRATGNAIISGNLTINGNLVYVNVDTLNVKDPIISLGGGPNGAPPVSDDGKDRGTALEYYNTSAKTAFIGWDTSNGEFGMGSVVTITNDVVTWTTYGNLRVGNIIGNGQALTGITGSTVTGTVANANYAAFAGNVTIAAQPNITSLGTLTSLTVTGNTTSGNFIGIFANGNSNVNIPAANGNVTVSVSGNANVLVVTATGANITGTANISGNANVGNLGAAQVLASANVTAPQLISNVSTGTAPLVVNSTTRVANLNVASSGVANTVNDAAQPNITSVGTLNSLDVTNNVSTGGIKTNNYYYANGSPVSFAGTYSNSNVQSYLPTYNGNVGGGSATFYGTTLTTGANTTAGTITGNWSLSTGSRLQSTYADLAEKYVADANYEAGTVLLFGGELEVTISDEYDSHRVAGVVSHNPAYIMNSECEGTNIVDLALQGRVPVKVIGPVNKGDLMVSGPNGHALANNMARAGTIIGKSLENLSSGYGVIEIVVGKV